MKKLILLLAFIVQALPAAHAADKAQQLKCDVGPLIRTYGGVSWLVYSCHDDESLTFVAYPDSPASPFYFSLFKKDGKYVLAGEGKGSKSLTDAADAELQKLTPDDIGKLIAGTKAVKKTPPLLCNIGPADEMLGGQGWHAYACDDDKTLYLVPLPESSPLPIPYFFYLIDGHYKLQLLPNKDEHLTPAGLAALQKLDDAGVLKLMADAKQAKQDLDATDAALRAQLVGHWTFSDKFGDSEVFFGADGSFSGTLKRGGKLLWTYGGTWVMERGNIVYTYTLSNPHPEKVGLIDVDHVQDMAPGCFTLISATTDVSRVCRVP